MVNCNPETVSTDYDTSDRLYFEPLTFEDVMNIIDVEKPKGVIVQFGGQTPLKLARALEAAGAPIIGTSPDSIDLAEDRERFQKLIESLELRQPPQPDCAYRRRRPCKWRSTSAIRWWFAHPTCSADGPWRSSIPKRTWRTYVREAVQVSNESPVLLDRFLDQAKEVDVDAICDGEDVMICGMMEHIEQAGVHSGDSGCSLPPFSLEASTQDAMREQIRQLAKALNVVGLMNTQFAVQNGVIYLLEVNPRASRTVPFVSKATGLSAAKIAALVMAGKTLKDLGVLDERVPPYFSVKESVFPFQKFPGADPILGPEMKSTGEVMGTGRSFGEAYAKAQLASGVILPRQGTALVSVRNQDKEAAVELARILVDRGFGLVATHGTAKAIAAAGIACRRVNKVREGRPHIVDLIKSEEITLIVNTTEGKQAIRDSHPIRAATIGRGITYYTTLAAARATCLALDHLDDDAVNRLQDLHDEVAA